MLDWLVWILICAACILSAIGLLSNDQFLYRLLPHPPWPKKSISIKLYVDDERTCPDGWMPARSYGEAMHYLMTKDVESVSLDHDLGEVRTGYDIMCWIEEHKPHLHVVCHSANPVGKAKIEQAIQACKRRRSEVE